MSYHSYLNYSGTLFESIVLVYFVLVNTIYLYLLFFAYFAILRTHNELEAEHLEILLRADALPSLSMIIPVYNESSTIIFCIETILNLPYRYKNLIVVNDGSTDDTLEILKKVFHLHPVHPAYKQEIQTNKILNYYQSQIFPNLVVINKENGGKADAINAAINACQSDYFISIDADTLIDGKELSRMIRHLLTHPEIKAAGATLRVANGCKIRLRGIEEVHFPTNLLAGFQVIEYLRGFLVGRMGWQQLGGSLIISGAFSFFETQTIKEIGGCDPKTVGEDMEVVVRFKRKMIEKKQSPKVGFVAEPVAWTEVPEEYAILAKQRTRWHIGLIQVLWKHKKMFFNPKYGVTGLLLFPFFVFAEMLGPIMELLGYLLIAAVLILGSGEYVFYFMLLSLGFMAFVNIYVVLLDLFAFHKYTSPRAIVKMLFLSVLESFGYRQLTMIWRLNAFFRLFKLYVTRKALHWDVVKKSGFQRKK